MSEKRVIPLKRYIERDTFWKERKERELEGIKRRLIPKVETESKETNTQVNEEKNNG